MRKCRFCGCDISKRHHSAVMCLDCYRVLNHQRALERARRKGISEDRGRGIWVAAIGDKPRPRAESDCICTFRDFTTWRQVRRSAQSTGGR